MSMKTPIADTLRNVIKARRLTGYGVAKDADVAPSVVNKFLRGERGLTLDSFERICSALGLTLTEDRRRRRSSSGGRTAPTIIPTPDLEPTPEIQESTDR